MVFDTGAMDVCGWFIDCFPDLCFLQFSVAQVLVGLGEQFIKIGFLQHWPVLLVLIITIIIIVHDQALV